MINCRWSVEGFLLTLACLHWAIKIKLPKYFILQYLGQGYIDPEPIQKTHWVKAGIHPRWDGTHPAPISTYKCLIRQSDRFLGGERKLENLKKTHGHGTRCVDSNPRSNYGTLML